jgi:hypothetical protein
MDERGLLDDGRMFEPEETQDTGQRDDEKATEEVLLGLVKEAHGFYMYDHEIKTTTKEGVTSTEVIVKERYFPPDPKALRLLKQQGIKYKMIRAKRET